MTPEQLRIYHTQCVKELANELGFMGCGISQASHLQNEEPRLKDWLNKGMHGGMTYMENYFDKRLNPSLLVEGATTVISLLYNYYPSETQAAGLPKISKYAYGEDYHYVIKDKMFELVKRLQEKVGLFAYRVFVDSAPVLEKVWAAKAGLGWIGKNTLLIHPKKGSFFFLSEIICDLDCWADDPIRSYCGTCTKCMDACPTQAIIKPHVLDASRCISYLTIELKKLTIKEKDFPVEDWVFGCDICQDVCPWNKFSTPHSEDRFHPDSLLLNMDKYAWMQMDEASFKKLFKTSPISRAKFQGMMRNISRLDE